MTWERDPLWAKSKLFLERAFAESSDDSLFGLWCSLGLELLARAALASVSPTLLAEPDREHRFLLHALNRGSKEVIRHSIKTAQVFHLSNVIYEGFSKDDLTSAMALVNRRNEELHTGAAAFSEYPSKVWLPGFYQACQILTKAIGESLESLLGAEQATIAAEVLSNTEKDVKKRVLDLISKMAKTFDAKSPEERARVAQDASTEVADLVHRRHHKVPCPACKSDATLQGQTFGPEQLSAEDNMIVVRQSVLPRSFWCSACGLKLQGYAELHVANLGGQYTRTTRYSPEEYYGLVDPETADLSPYMEKYIDAYLEDMAAAREWDNE